MDGLMVFNSDANVHPLRHVSFGPSESQSESASRSVQPFS